MPEHRRTRRIITYHPLTVGGLNIARRANLTNRGMPEHRRTRSIITDQPPTLGGLNFAGLANPY